VYVCTQPEPGVLTGERKGVIPQLPEAKSPLAQVAKGLDTLLKSKM
jgi:hypothetical protein